MYLVMNLNLSFMYLDALLQGSYRGWLRNDSTSNVSVDDDVVIIIYTIRNVQEKCCFTYHNVRRHRRHHLMSRRTPVGHELPRDVKWRHHRFHEKDPVLYNRIQFAILHNFTFPNHCTHHCCPSHLRWVNQVKVYFTYLGVNVSIDDSTAVQFLLKKRRRNRDKKTQKTKTFLKQNLNASSMEHLFI